MANGIHNRKQIDPVLCAAIYLAICIESFQISMLLGMLEKTGLSRYTSPCCVWGFSVYPAKKKCMYVCMYDYMYVCILLIKLIQFFVRIYVDAVINHMTGGGSGVGSNGSYFDGDKEDFPGVPFSAWDFHGRDVCYTNDLNIHDYNNAQEV